MMLTQRLGERRREGGGGGEEGGLEKGVLGEGMLVGR